jgi:hypothetical protein
MGQPMPPKRGHVMQKLLRCNQKGHVGLGLLGLLLVAGLLGLLVYSTTVASLGQLVGALQ